MSLEELQKVIKEKAIFGIDRVLKNLKLGKLKKVFIASNCPDDMKQDVIYYANLNKVSIVELKIPSDEVGLVAKKLYSINVLGI